MIELEYVTPSIEEAIDMIIFKINLKHDCLISSVIYSQTELKDGPMSESPLYKVKGGSRLAPPTFFTPVVAESHFSFGDWTGNHSLL